MSRTYFTVRKLFLRMLNMLILTWVICLLCCRYAPIRQLGPVSHCFATALHHFHYILPGCMVSYISNWVNRGHQHTFYRASCLLLLLTSCSFREQQVRSITYYSQSLSPRPRSMSTKDTFRMCLICFYVRLRDAK